MASIDPRNLMMSNGGGGSGQHYSRVANPAVHPGALHSPMPQYYMLLDQRRIERVPRPPEMDPPHEGMPAITFSAHGWPGVRVRDLLKGTVIIDAAHDAVFGHHGWRSTVINLAWPGYDPRLVRDPMLCRLDVQPGGRDITRQELAREISGILFDFSKIVCRHTIAPGWEKWALTSGPEGIRVTDIVLLSLHHYHNVWVPEFYVLE